MSMRRAWEDNYKERRAWRDAFYAKLESSTLAWDSYSESDPDPFEDWAKRQARWEAKDRDTKAYWANRLAARDRDSKRNDDVLLSRLFVAIALGDFDLAKSLIDSGVNVAREPELLLQAIFSAGGAEAKCNMIELLVSRGADVTYVWDRHFGDYYQTPYTAAVSTGCIETIKLLLRKGANFYDSFGYISEDLYNPFESACENGDVPLIEALLEYRPVLAKCDNHDYVSEAIYSTICSYYDNEKKTKVIKMLLAKRTHTDFYINSLPLLAACGSTEFFGPFSTPNPDMVRLLIECGARVDAAVLKGRNAMHVLCDRKYMRVYHFSMDGGAVENDEEEEREEEEAVLDSSVECAEILLEYGADVNASDEMGVGPLHLACAENNPKPQLVRFLLENGADVDAVTKRGNTALHVLCSAADHGPHAQVASEGRLARVDRRRVECVKLLLEHGAEVDVVNEYGDVPFVLAVEAGKEEIMELLLAHYKARAGLDYEEDEDN